MAWRVANSLDKLLAQLNAHYPRRSKASDGGIGDAAHASRSSDHNPWVKDGSMGVVTARDYTHDPANGMDCERLYQALIASRDPRIKYVIWNRTITSGALDTQPWKRRPYSGSNPHTKHLHLSVRPEKSRYDDARPWAIEAPTSAPKPAPKPAPAQEEFDVTAAKQIAEIHAKVVGLVLPLTGRPGAQSDDMYGHVLSGDAAARQALAKAASVEKKLDEVLALLKQQNPGA